ncbi:hypothetical protein PTTG_29330, partial [Puccinia triticina 1-1 BBBD Race 1]
MAVWLLYLLILIGHSLQSEHLVGPGQIHDAAVQGAEAPIHGPSKALQNQFELAIPIGNCQDGMCIREKAPQVPGDGPGSGDRSGGEAGDTAIAIAPANTDADHGQTERLSTALQQQTPNTPATRGHPISKPAAWCMLGSAVVLMAMCIAFIVLAAR